VSISGLRVPGNNICLLIIYVSTCGEDCILYARVAISIMIIVRLLLEEIGPCLFLA
jgi:hypothetical protein